MKPMLEAKNLGKIFKIRHTGLKKEYLIALREFNFTIDEEKPRITAIAGESGSGKTTLVRILLGFLAPDEGEILYRGIPVSRLDKNKRVTYRTDIQAVFQDPYEVYNYYYRVDHILETPLRKFNIASEKSEMRKKIEHVLDMVGLRPDETLGRFPHQISGGQRQRIMIARALLLNPKLIIADEPVSMVDASLRATILDKLLRLNKELDISLIYVTHDLTTAYQLCDDIIILYQGRIVESGDVESVIKTPAHPYTQLLINSIPLPDPDKPWGNPEDKLEIPKIRQKGCPFYDRCPHVMNICETKEPSLTQIEGSHKVRCYLYHKTNNLS